ncbi:MAG: xylulokinase [Paracoccaceae bacterium]
MYLGLDLGTSGLKAIVVDEAQGEVAAATAPLTVQRPHDGWSEQDPASWIDALDAVMAELAAACDLSAIRAIGLSGQMHGATCLDAGDRPLRPCILWNDTRAHAQAAALDADPRFRAITGNIVFPGFTAPKLAWMREAEPALFAATARVLLPKDHLRLHLTGEAVSEPSDASGTAWLDVAARDWSDELLAATHLSRDHMPRLVEGSAPSGDLRAELAARWGMARVPVAGGGGDNAASAVGAGVVDPGTGFASLGTSGVLFAATPRFAPDPDTAVHAFAHAIPGTWHQMGVILSAADSLTWIARATGRTPAALTAQVEAAQPPAKPLFLPYLGGERTPHNDAALRGQLLHLDHATDAPALARAVMEGVAFAFRDNLDALSATGTRIERLLGLGGGTASRAWVSMLASALDMPVELPKGGERGGAFGAARLAMMADGAGPGIATMPEPETVIDPTHTGAWADAHARFRSATATIRSLE